jgi:hypothetical protein
MADSAETQNKARMYEHLCGALRKAFPHFQDDRPITPEAVEAIGKEYLEMVMGWAPQADTIDFQDQDGETRSIVYESGEPMGPSGGWCIPDDADWEVQPVQTT